jgi:RecA/RadA recombinase
MTEYMTKWDGSIKTIDATVETGRKTQAGVEAKNYDFAQIPESDYLTCIDKANDAAYVLLRIGEGAKQEIGCSCDYFKKERKTCEHLYALRDIDASKLDASPNWLVEFLQVDNDWHIDDNNRLVPPSTGSEKVVPEVVASVPPTNEEPPKKEKRTCPHCNLTMPASRYEQHLSVCKKNPAKQKPQGSPTVEPPPREKPKPPVIPQDPEIDIGVDVEQEPPKEPGVKKTVPKTDKPKKSTSIFDNIEDLIEFGVGQIFGDTGTGKTAFCREVAEQAADAGKKVVYWDSEGNMTRKQRASMNEHKNIKYVLDRDWHHIKNMLNDDLSKGAYKLGKCDLFILDSIGVPVLGIYGTMKQNQKGEALQGMQGLLYNLTVWAEANSAVVIVTNQPVSEMNKTKEQIADRHPFGDKAMFFTKEILKIVIGERNEYKTVCHLLAWRSRSRGRGAMLGKVTISDKGTEIEFGG